MMKQIVYKLQIISLIVALQLGKATRLFAQGDVGNIPPDSGDVGNVPDTTLKNPLKDEFSSIPALLSALLDLVVMVAVPIAILFLIYAGFLFVSARGSEEKLTKAKSVLLYTVIGIALIVGAALLANVIEGTIDQLQGTASLLIIHHS